MKSVQSHLGQMSDPRLHFAEFDGQPPEPSCFENEPGAPDQKKRVCELFGTTYHPGADPNNQESQPSPRGRQVFPRLTALLIASTCPLDRKDAEEGRIYDLTEIDLCGGDNGIVEVTAENWWWELPPFYRDIPGLPARAAQMRADVLYWLEHADIRVTNTPGSGGSFDLDAIATLHFLYTLRDHPELLPDTDVLVRLLRHGMDAQDYAALELKQQQMHGDDAWEQTATFQSGNRFSASMDEEVGLATEQGPIASFSYPETENHVLIRATYQYLINQWLAHDYHQNLVSNGHHRYTSDTFLGDMQNHPDFEGWFENYPNGHRSELVTRLLAAVHRVNHNGFLEANAAPDYQAISVRPLLMLATWAEDEEVRLAAENALHMASAQFAFQSLHGRRLAPARRSCDYAWSNKLYDGMTLAMGALSGAYRWNDSPYGYRWVLESVAADTDTDTDADPDPSLCDQGANAEECYYRSYTWKSPKVDLVGDPFTDNTPYNENGNLPGVPSAGSGEVETIEEMVMEARGGLYEALSGYEIPEAIHHFMLTKQDGYFARMTGRFDEHHHPEQIPGNEYQDNWPQFFNADLTRWDGGQRDERVPEFYFAGRDFMQVAGGVMNPLWFGVEPQGWDFPSKEQQWISGGFTCSREVPWLHYLLHYGRQDDFPEAGLESKNVGGTSLVVRNIGLEEYDFYSRPTTLLLGVPRTKDPVTGAPIYKPYGLRAFPFEELARFLPTFPGNRGEEWRSVNDGVWKNFAYGYDTSSGKSWAHTTPWESDPEVEVHTFDFHGVDSENPDGPGLEFKIYDLRDKMAQLGLDGFWLITARVWKRQVGLEDTTVSRGFWEIVPEHAFGDVEKIRSEIQSLNSLADFPPTGNDEYHYTSIYSGDEHVLKPRFGYLLPGHGINDIQESVQGIEVIVRGDNTLYPLGNYYTAMWSDAVMEALPLIDVKAVDQYYQFAWRDTAETDPTSYACARDGWMCVNAIDPANPSTTTPYLWVDARRCQDRPGVSCADTPHWEPHWESGTYDATTETWPCSCMGRGVGWVPGPPETGTADEGGGVPPPPGGGDDDGCVPPACGGCESSYTACETDADCTGGNICQWQYVAGSPVPLGKCGCPGDAELCESNVLCAADGSCPNPHHLSCTSNRCICENTP